MSGQEPPYRVFVVRLHSELIAGATRWRGVVEAVGSDASRAIGDLDEIAAFIQATLPHDATGERGSAA